MTARDTVICEAGTLGRHRGCDRLGISDLIEVRGAGQDPVTGALLSSATLFSDSVYAWDGTADNGSPSLAANTVCIAEFMISNLEPGAAGYQPDAPGGIAEPGYDSAADLAGTPQNIGLRAVVWSLCLSPEHSPS